MRGKIVAATIMALSLVSVPWCPVAAVDEGAAVQVIETEGIATVIDQNLALARSEAVRNALQNSVEAVVARWLPTPQNSSPERRLWERFLSRAEVHILDFRILSESSASEIYTVAVRVTVSEKGVRGDLQRLGLIEPERGSEAAVTRITVRVFGVREYSEYVRCKSVLREQVPALRRVTLREALWGVARFDIEAEESAESLGIRLRETAAFEILHQDARLLEAYLR